MPPPEGSIKRYRDPSVCLSKCYRRAAAVGYRYAGCLQLSHMRTADPSADGHRSAASRTAMGGGISSHGYNIARLVAHAGCWVRSPIQPGIAGVQRDGVPFADGSSTRGGSTSVRGRVRSPHISGGRRWLTCRQPAPMV